MADHEIHVRVFRIIHETTESRMFTSFVKSISLDFRNKQGDNKTNELVVLGFHKVIRNVEVSSIDFFACSEDEDDDDMPIGRGLFN